MKISGVELSSVGDRSRVAALVSWEDCDREDFELFFELPSAHAGMLSTCADTFLIANLIPAYEYGETRLRIDGAICPILRSNIDVASTYIYQWHYRHREKLKIDTPNVAARLGTRPPPKSAQMFSGGIDSYSTLILDRQYVDPGHPEYTRVAILAFGLEQDDPTAFEYVTDMLEKAAEQLQLTLIPVASNIYLPYRDEDSRQGWEFWVYRQMCTALASFGHALSDGCTRLSIAANDPLAHQFTFHAADNPLVQENLSSDRMKVRHSGGHLTRLEKVRLVANSSTMLEHLRVCNQYKRYSPGKLNCGKCEKCVRTMLSLLAVGALDKTPCFAEIDLNAGLVGSVKPGRNEVIAAMYQELRQPLRERGRDDLIAPIDRLIAQIRGRRRRSIVSKRNLRRAKRAIRKLKRQVK